MHVTVTPKGAILGVEVASGWRAEARDHGLPSLIHDTYAQACATQAAELMATLDEVSREPTGRVALPTPDLQPVGVTGRSGDARLTDIATQGGGLVALIEAFTDQITAAFAAQHLGTSVAGRVTVVVDGQGSLASWRSMSGG